MKLFILSIKIIVKYILFCLICFQLTVFAQSQSQSQTSENLQQTKSELDLIHLGDVIEIDVIGSIEYDWRGTLTPEGFLSGFDTIEDQIFALCQSEEQIAAVVAKSYAKMLREPKVSVRIIDRSNRPIVLVYGAVKLPHRFQINREVQLTELIVLVGGFNEKTSGEIQIIRPQNQSCGKKNVLYETLSENSSEKYIPAAQDNGTQYINIRITDLLSGKKDSNIKIYNGDIITVSEASPIYVIGAVTQPKQISTRSEMTLSRAIASAGGLTKEAEPDKITIFRRINGQTKVIEADLNKIKANQAEDLKLQAYDIIEVSQKGREKRKFPPIVNVEDFGVSDQTKMPLRVID